MTGQTISHYRILEELGSGGMSVVYRAEDVRLGRQVAIKFVPPSFAASPELLERFRREARLASGLNHPHICTVHDIGEHEGRQFIVMECLEGTTVKRALLDGSLPVARVVQVGIEVAEALEAAHASGIIHRDIKPANVFLTARGVAKVMDFGLAKVVPADSPASDVDVDATGPARPEDHVVLTNPGATLGTMAYMSPEQARGESLDARTDLFSLGAVLYEMATGQRAFPGQTAAIVFDAILNRSPRPATEVEPGLPADLVAIVDRALHKDRQQRYQSAADLLADLRQVERRVRSGGAPVLLLGAATAPEAGRRRRRAWVVAAGIVLLALAGVALWRAWRAPGPAPLTDRDSVLVGDFSNATGESVFDDTLRQALAVQLGQSPFLNLVGDERVNETLRLMGRQPGERLAHDVAREVCQRQDVKAVIEGSITAIGSQYVVALVATGCQDGEVIAREQEEADRREAVLRAIGTATSRLRARLGESLGTLRSFDVPIEQATTPSLEALKAYTLGTKERARGVEIDSIPFFERAIELDPRFASAYNMLSTVYGNLGESARATEYARKAFAERDRVSERERLSITHQYYDRVTGELDKSAEALLLWEQSYPRDYRPSNSLSVLYNRTGQYERAVGKGLEAFRRNPNHPFPYSNLSHAYRGLNQFDEAKRVAEQAAARKIETLPTRRLLYQIALVQGDADAAARHFDATRGRGREFDMTGAQAQIAVFEGRLNEARTLYRRAQEMAGVAGLPEVSDGYAVQAGWMEVLLGSRTTAAQLSTLGLDTPNLPARLGAATVLALAGQGRGLEKVVDDVAHEHPADTMLINVSVPMARAALALNAGQPARAIQDLRAASPYELGRMAVLGPVYLRGVAFLQLKNGTAAAAEFRRILDHRGVDPFSGYYALAPLGLARGLALTGDTRGAREAYTRFIAGWPHADTGLAVLAAARDELAALGK